MNDIERLLKVASANDLKTFLKDYARSNEAMSCMCQLHNGKQAAHQLAEFFRQEYRRRPKMMEKIREF